MTTSRHLRFWRGLLLAALLLAAAALPAAAQEQPELRLRMSRDFGYAAGSDIQGTFSITASGPDDLARVVFFIDGARMGEAAQPPFKLRFDTGQYSLGPHTIYALGTTAAGREVRSNEIHANFVSAAESWETVQRIMLPILAITAAVMLLSFGLAFTSGRKLQNLPPGTPRQYGPAGGAICRRCQRPFPRHFLSPNMLVGKLERCAFCGKWSIVPAMPLAMLRTAEAAELETAAPDLPPGDPEAGLRKAIDESRYID